MQITVVKNCELMKNAATSGKLIKAVCASQVYVYRIEPYNYQLNCELLNYGTA